MTNFLDCNSKKSDIPIKTQVSKLFQRIYILSRLISPSSPFVVAPSAINFSFLLFLVLKSSQQDPYRKPATMVKPAEQEFPTIYLGPCCVG